MYITIVCAAALGATLGPRFNVLVLISATAAVIVIAAIEFTAASRTWTNVLWDVIPVLALQAGCFVGLFFRQRVPSQRAFPFRPMASRFPRR